MPSLQSLMSPPPQATPFSASTRIRLVAGASALAIATIMRRKDAARALN